MLAPLVLTTFFTLGAPASCPMPDKPPTIDVNVGIFQPSVDHSVGQDKLKTFQIATVSPYGHNVNVHVNGLTRGAFTTETKASLAWQHTADGSVNCSWYDKITINLDLKPTIFIAREIPEGSCMYTEVLNHEYKHYKTDYDIAQDYKLVFQDEVLAFLLHAGVAGPYTTDRQNNVRESMMKRLDDVVRDINERMKNDRIKRQAAIDTLAEYERVAAACRGQPGSM